ncbi:MAG: cbb3-type cytochrome c oxidase subunit 3 [Phycisphaerales bacterium]|nr:cbb3-type cytochrome c oxidase subunit 3 [Phycisphaerales bacterium]
MLRQVTSSAGLSIFSQIGLVIFVVTFIAIVAYILLRPKSEMNEAARQPLEDGTPTKQERRPAQSGSHHS